MKDFDEQSYSDLIELKSKINKEATQYKRKAEEKKH